MIEIESVLTPVVPARELRLLVDGLEHWVRSIGDRAATTGSACIGWLDGEDASGRAVLVEALIASCRALGIRSFSVDCGADFHAFGEPVRQALAEVVDHGIADADDRLRSALEKHRARLVALEARGDADCEARSRTETRASDGSSHAVARADLVHSAAACLLESARRSPLVLVFEQVDRADALTAEILRHLVRLLSEAPCDGVPRRLLLVATGERPIEMIGLTSRRRIEEMRAFDIRVRGYSRDDIGACAQRAGVSLGVSDRESLFRATAGHVRRVRHLLARGAGAAVSERDLNLAAIPSLIESQYRELGSKEKLVLLGLLALRAPVDVGRLERWIARSRSSLASVLARLVADERSGVESGVARAEASGMAGGSRDELLAAIDSLVRRGWVTHVVRRSRADLALVAVDPEIRPMLLVHEPPSVLRSIGASWLELLLDEDPSPISATGWLARFLAADDEHARAMIDRLEPERQRAIVSCWRASTKALSRLGPELALEFLEAGWEALDRFLDPGVRVEIRASWIDLLERAGNHREALDARLRGLDDSIPADRKLIEWAHVARLAALADEEKICEDALEHAHQLVCGETPLADRIELSIATAEAALALGDAERAMLRSNDALGLVEGDASIAPATRIRAFAIAQRSAFSRGDLSQAEELERRLLDERQAAGDLSGLERSHAHLSTLAAIRGDRDRAIEHAREALTIAEDLGGDAATARALRRLGELLLDARLLDEAEDRLSTALRAFRLLGDELEERKILDRLLELELRRGDFAAARRLLSEAPWADPDEPTFDIDEPSMAVDAARRERTRSQGYRRSRLESLKRQHEREGDRMTTDALLELVRCEYEAGRFSDACEHIAEALARPAFRDGGGAARATLLLYQGRIESLRGRASDAASSYERSLKVWPVTAERVLLAEAWIDIGALLSRLGQLDRALEHMIRGLRLALDEDEPNAIVHALHHLALFLVDADESVAATELAKAAAQIARSQGDFAAELRSIAVLVRASLESSRPESLDAVLERGRELARDPTLPVEAAAFRLEEAWVVYSRGDLATAMQLARGVVETARSLELRPLLADVLLLIACIDGHPDNPRSNVVRALESLERLLDADEARASPRVRFEVLRALEAFYRGRGKDEVAHTYEERAIELLGRLAERLPPELQRLSWGCRPIRQTGRLVSTAAARADA